jgi:hypothetical protein
MNKYTKFTILLSLFPRFFFSVAVRLRLAYREFIFLSALLTFSIAVSITESVAQVTPFETTRLKSTAGTGVASILVAEAALLNPASIVFFTDSYLSYQNNKIDLQNTSQSRLSEGAHQWGGARDEGVFIFDNQQEEKGGFSYQRQRVGGYIRQRGTFTMASALAPNLGFGINYRYTDDSRPSGVFAKSRKISHSASLGLTWIAREGLSLAAIWEDPTKALNQEQRYLIGAQYDLTPDLNVLVDAGANMRGSWKDERVIRGAAQFRIFGDFFIRTGRFVDKSLNLEGTGYGASWTGPKLGIDFGVKRSKQIEKKKDRLYEGEKIEEVSFALNLHF